MSLRYMPFNTHAVKKTKVSIDHSALMLLVFFVFLLQAKLQAGMPAKAPFRVFSDSFSCMDSIHFCPLRQTFHTAAELPIKFTTTALPVDEQFLLCRDYFCSVDTLIERACIHEAKLFLYRQQNLLLQESRDYSQSTPRFTYIQFRETSSFEIVTALSFIYKSDWIRSIVNSKLSDTLQQKCQNLSIIKLNTSFYGVHAIYCSFVLRHRREIHTTSFVGYKIKQQDIYSILINLLDSCNCSNCTIQ